MAARMPHDLLIKRDNFKCLKAMHGRLSYLMGLSSRSFSMFMGYSRKGGVDCQSRFVSLVCTSRRSRNGLLPSGEAPPPVYA